MQIIRPSDPFPYSVTQSIFLLGPIPRTLETKHLSWKPEAYRLLEELGYDGVVYDPEHEGSFSERRDESYERGFQIDWETAALDRADAIVAWVPRQLPEMPAMTSNFELGERFKSGRLLLGFPEGTPRMEYIKYRADDWLKSVYQWQVPVYHDLREILAAAVEWIGGGAERSGDEIAVPLNIWNDPSFQCWYRGVRLSRHILSDFKIEYVFCRGQDKSSGRPKQRIWAARPNLMLPEENRYKGNEIIIGRPPTVSVLMYYPDGSSVLDWRIVLVDECRPACVSHHGHVCELPGGSIEPSSAIYDDDDIVIRSSAAREILEETGLLLDPAKLDHFDDRQGLGTLAVCEHYLYTYQLSRTEFDLIDSKTNCRPRPAKDDAEQTYPVIAPVDDLLYDRISWSNIDWVNMGMIMSFVASAMRRLGVD
ncbi:MAG: nucleoside 2-deoxyribosyltransferase domain-containing protein [Patescibacteria group bacterium]